MKDRFKQRLNLYKNEIEKVSLRNETTQSDTDRRNHERHDFLHRRRLKQQECLSSKEVANKTDILFHIQQLSSSNITDIQNSLEWFNIHLKTGLTLLL